VLASNGNRTNIIENRQAVADTGSLQKSGFGVMIGKEKIDEKLQTISRS
jgi:hypothetical protein